MRLAFADLYFSWPPHGGADVDLYHVAQGLQALGHEVRLFVSSCPDVWDRGTVDPNQVPFPVTPIEAGRDEWNPNTLPGRFRQEIDAWKPDVVLLTFGYFLKPFIAEALSHYPIISRYYAYEMTCPRDLCQFKNNAPCPMDYLRTPDACRRCALEAMGPDIKQWHLLTWTDEYLCTEAHTPAYYDRLVSSLEFLDAIVVYNRIQKAHFDGWHDNVHIMPGGVPVADFVPSPPEERPMGEPKVIVMTGRAEDPVKGMAVLYEAGRLLSERRTDFEIRVTYPDHDLDTTWFKATGWLGQAEVKQLYRAADICVVPSVWEEPFGIVAVEAMAFARPVCASRVGGLQDIVVEGETGFIFDRGNSAALAEQLNRLLDEPALRREMGAAGRRRAEAEYDWAQLVAKHYTPLLEALS